MTALAEGHSHQEQFFAQLPGMLQAFQLFDYLPNVSFFAKNRDGRFVKANPRFLNDHGLKKESDLLGRNDHDFHTPEMAQRYIDEDRKIFESGRALPDQVWLVPDSDRILHWFVSTKMPLTNEAGEVVGLAGVMRDAKTAGSLLSPYSDLSPVLDHVMRHFDQRLRIPELAGMVNLSVSQFERRFAKLFGMTPVAYILRVRLNESARRLVQTSAVIGTIAQECGFYDQSSFTRLFRRQYGQTPNQYRVIQRDGADGSKRSQV